MPASETVWGEVRCCFWFVVDYGKGTFNVRRMKQWTLTLHGPNGVLNQLDSGEAHFVVGSEQGGDVITVSGEGVAARHARVSLNLTGVQVEDLGSGIGTLVNGYLITERVEVSYPASVQIGELTLVVEENPIVGEIGISEAAAPASDVVKVTIPARVRPSGTGASPEMGPLMTPSPQSANTLPDIAITIPQRTPPASKPNLDVTVPRKAPPRSARQQVAEKVAAKQAATKPDAPLTGGYTLVREIARGGMGQIYFGEDPQLKREVAVKVSSISEGGEDPRFTKEAEVLAQLAHPNVVPIYNIGVDGERRPFYAMKLVKGRTLQAVLTALRDRDPAAVKDYPLATLLTIFRKVCDAMAFAHSKRILHRDLKPENIMVGEYGEVLVMDWGLAKVLGGSGGEVTGGDAAVDVPGRQGHAVTPAARVNESGDFGMTMEGEVMGTPQYMSPEQAEGMVAELDERSDIYSLGGVLYAILTLRPPIDGKTLNEVLSKVKNGHISSMITKRGGKDAVQVGTPAAIGGEVPEALRAVTLKAMAKERAKRYASVEEFAADLESYQNGFATRAEDAGALRLLLLFIKRNKAVAGVVALFLVAAAGFTVRLGIEREQARASEKRALANEREAAENARRAEENARRATESEQQAKENEQRAVANEHKATAETEKARREAAKAMVALAEAAEESGDSEAMRSALAKVPPDLRDSIWEYLDDRSDSADLKVAPLTGGAWLHVDKCPDDPDSVVAVQTNGQVCTVNTNTGLITPLWKAERKGASLFGFSVSEEGKRIALLWSKGDYADIEVRGLWDGVRQGPETIATQSLRELERGGHGVEIASKFLFVWSKINASSADLEAWDLDSGQKLWTRGGVQTFRWDSKSESLFALSEKMKRVSAVDGKVLWSGNATHRFHWNFPRTVQIDCEKKRLLSALPDARSMRLYDLQDGVLGWEAHYRFGSPLSLTHDPDGRYVGVLSWRSVLGSVFEIRDASNGTLVGVRPFVWKKFGGGYDNTRIACTRTAFVVGFSKRILVWRFGKTPPVEATKLVYGNRGSNYGIMLPMEGGTRVARIAQKVGGAKSELWLSHFGDRERDQNAPIEFSGNGLYLAADASGKRLSLFQSRNRHGLIAAYRVTGDRFEEVFSPRKLEGAYFALPAPAADRLWAGKKVVEFSTGNTLASLNLAGLEFMRLGRRYEKSAAWVGEEHLVAPVLKAGGGADAAQERLLAIWSAATGELLAQAAADQIRSLAVSPDGRWVVEGGEDKRVRIRNGRTLKVEHEFRAHERAVTGVIWHPRLPLLVTRDEARVRIWDTQTWRKVEELQLEPGDGALHIQGDGTRLSVTDDGGVELYEPASFQK